VNRKHGPFGLTGRTAASASNSQEIDVYAALPQGTYLYDPMRHGLLPAAAGDLRPLAIGRGQRRLGDAAPIRPPFGSSTLRPSEITINSEAVPAVSVLRTQSQAADRAVLSYREFAVRASAGAARIRSEKSSALSAAWASALMRLLCCSCANGRLVSSLPDS